MPPEFSDEAYQRHAEAKTAALERILGPLHDVVYHAIIPFAVGGPVDMYCFPEHVSGSAFATMELIEPDGSGPQPNRFGTYELVAFTKRRMPAEADVPDDHPFSRAMMRIRGILTNIAHFSREAVLNPGETCEIPGDEDEPGTCLIFDEYAPDGVPFEIGGKKHGLLLVIEVFRSEMEYAMEHGSTAVLQKLKEAGHYPYSDLDREPVY